MGDVLAGFHTVWEFDTDSVLIRFERGIRTPKLLQALGERRIPHEALAAVERVPGRRGTVALRAVPRPGADPLMEAAGDQLRETSDPYRLELPAEREPLAAYWADEIRGALGPSADEPAERHLVAAPDPPLSFKAYDGKAAFDGRTVSFRWSRTGASTAKWKAGDQHFAVEELAGVEWRSPDAPGGRLRLLRRGADALAAAPSAADQDAAAVVFGRGYGLLHESLPFAAAVLAAVRCASPAAATVSAAVRPDPAAVADRIRHLGALHSAGLLTDAEFTAKKAELLAEL
ncbi:DUF4429 domain-containing protein [Streptomyces sp. AV19]|uniref:DUF4429 domain-containing protein n=1 Tax=Streptomyces sp. AV19 TaxID=2793068 RepID=UPI0018FE7EB7|nr:DUF4429 domain-containing protein [Streptomyces sp. AV19]MBH1933359.1 DUF4429 domain-containing protein [Streptomyces sp. AV19]MDG4531970.1 DUF4429 domain-containing protein [Streptomyces sp. AV19]